MLHLGLSGKAICLFSHKDNDQCARRMDLVSTSKTDVLRGSGSQ